MIGFDRLNKEVVSIGLCADCGTCVGVCPNTCLVMDYRAEEPQLVKECLPDCKLCWEVCPGKDVPMLSFDRMLFGRERGTDEMLLGIVETFVKCHAADPVVRANGGGGGVISALLIYALENAINLRKSPAILYSALEMRSMSEVSLMENKFETGNVDAAWEHMILFEKESAHTDFDYIRERWEIRMNDLKGNILKIRGDLEGAEEQARICHKTAMKRDYKKYIGKSERLNGEILLARGAYDQAEGRFMKALAKLEEVGNPKQLWMTHTALADLYKRMNRSDLEREQWQKAAQIVTCTADELRDSNLKENFVNAAPVRQILENAK